jgi:hypothetical protein
VDDPAPFDPAAAQPSDRFDPEVAWWRHERLHRLALRDLPASLARFSAERDRVEAGWIDDPPPGSLAVQAAAELDDRWLADLAGAGLPDRRPRWLRRLWRKLDAAAGVPDAAVAA